MEWPKPEHKSPKSRQYARKWKAIARYKRYEAYIKAEAARPAHAPSSTAPPIRVIQPASVSLKRNKPG